jgi:hypothetical protein
MSKSIVSAGDQWKEYMKQFPKLEEFWQTIPEATNTWLSQQIDIFAGKYPASQFKESQPTEVERMKEELQQARQDLKEAMEECERLAQVGETWQKKYYELNPPRQPVRLDFNLPPSLDSTPNTQADEDYHQKHK